MTCQCTVCDLYVSDFVSHSQRHLKESAIEFTKTGSKDALIKAPISFREVGTTEKLTTVRFA